LTKVNNLPLAEIKLAKLESRKIERALPDAAG
jgi:hypothetical protein